MKKVIFILFALWVILALGLKIAGLVSWWVALSWLWFPLGVAYVVSLAVFFSVNLGEYFKRKQDLKIPDACENCLHHHTKEYSPDGVCLGQALNPDHKEGELCQFYRRHNS